MVYLSNDHGQSPIQVLTGPGTELLHWLRPTHYHYTKRVILFLYIHRQNFFKFPLTLTIFGTKMAVCELDELENECTSHNFSLFARFVPKIIGVGGNLTKF